MHKKWQKFRMHLIKSLYTILTLTACKNVNHGQDDGVKKVQIEEIFRINFI